MPHGRHSNRTIVFVKELHGESAVSSEFKKIATGTAAGVAEPGHAIRGESSVQQIDKDWILGALVEHVSSDDYACLHRRRLAPVEDQAARLRLQSVAIGIFQRQ